MLAIIIEQTLNIYHRSTTTENFILIEMRVVVKKNYVGEFINLKPCKLQKIRIISPFAVGRPLHMAVSSMTLQVREYTIQSDNHSSARPHIAASPYIRVGSLLSLTFRLDWNIMGSAL